MELIYPKAYTLATSYMDCDMNAKKKKKNSLHMQFVFHHANCWYNFACRHYGGSDWQIKKYDKMAIIPSNSLPPHMMSLFSQQRKNMSQIHPFPNPKN